MYPIIISGVSFESNEPARNIGYGCDLYGLEEEKPNQREQIKLRADALAKYFPEDYTPKQKTDLIEQLLKEWYEKQEYSKQESLGSSRGRAR